MKTIYLSIILLLAAVCAGCDVNEIPTYDEQVKSTWSEVENQYKRRADLIPNLIAVAREAANHELSTLERIANARNRVNDMDTSNLLDNNKKMMTYQQQQATIGKELHLIFGQLAQYPTLQANQNYLQLSSQIEGTENRIAIARREFIQAIGLYNTALKTYPGKFYHQYLYSDYKLRDDDAYFSLTEKKEMAAPVVSP